jgi:hypothetical protein
MQLIVHDNLISAEVATFLQPECNQIIYNSYNSFGALKNAGEFMKISNGSNFAEW